MASGQQRSTHNAYVYGSAVRKSEPVRRRPAQVDKRPVLNHTIRRNQERALHMDLPYVVVLTIAALCALSICVSYLHVQSSITGRIISIEILERKLEQLKSENDSLATRINTSIDLDHVYKVATEELGMVYANRNQVLLYDKTESEYVRQYEDVPKH